MTKVCTAYTSCRILEEMGLLDLESVKNIYLRTSKKASHVCGTSAQL